MNALGEKPVKHPEAQIEFERYEAKYIIPRQLVPQIREFIRPFCIPDPNTEGTPPEYIITTLQLDSPFGTLHYAKEQEVFNRFKLRVRTYGLDGKAPVFVEIKRKMNGVVLKSRAMMPAEFWGKEACHGHKANLSFKSRHQALNYREFVRLVDAINARPVMLIRYTRESYLSKIDSYARVTFDRRMCYSPARTYTFPGPDVRWWSMDSGTALNRPFSGLILELKTYRDAPAWMVELTARFNLVRTGFCKYSTAMRLESLFQGAMYSEQSENCTQTIVGI